MTDQTTNNNPDPGKKVKRIRKPPEVIKVGKREIIANGRLNPPLVASKIIAEGQAKWVQIDDIARYACGGRVSDANRKHVRRRLPAVREELANRGFFLLTEGHPFERVKIYTGADENEHQIATHLIASRETRRDHSTEILAKMEAAVAAVKQQPAA